jgi:hypothetical protein
VAAPTLGGWLRRARYGFPAAGVAEIAHHELPCAVALHRWPTRRISRIVGGGCLAVIRGGNMKRTITFVLFNAPGVSTGARAAGEKFFVIAESVSTSMEARRIIREQRWEEAPLRRAEYVLVVVRSRLMMPLSGIYERHR